MTAGSATSGASLFAASKRASTEIQQRDLEPKL